MRGKYEKMTDISYCKVCILLLAAFLVQRCGCLNIVSEFYLDDDALGDSACGQVIDSKDSVYLRSHIGAGALGGLNSYDPNEDCTTTFTVDSGYQILVQFPFFNLQQPNGSTCLDKVQLQETTLKEEEQVSLVNVTMVNVTVVCNGTGLNETCWNVTSNYTVLENTTQTINVPEVNTTVICQNPEPFISSANSLEVGFISDTTIQRTGFSMLLTAFQNSPCNDSELFLCDSNRCIAKTLTCDGTDHCIDKSDETKEHASCSTIDKIVGKLTGLGKNVVIGIIVVVSGLICTIVIIIIMWKSMNRDSESCCTSDTVDEESHTPRTTGIRKVTSELKSSQLNKQKKSVSIVTEKGKDQKEKKTVSKKPNVRKVAPARSNDVDW